MKKKVVILLKMLALSMVLILAYRIGDESRSDKEQKLTSDALYAEGAYTIYDFAMGTSVCVSIYDDSGKTEEYSTKVIEEIKDIDESVISWRSPDSELYVLNHSYQPQEKYNLSDSLYPALDEALQICYDSGGALDVTIRPLAQVWNIEEADSETFTVPDENAIKEALEHVGYESVSLSEAENTVTIGEPGIVIDLGAVGKGYALDVAKEYLDEWNVDGAVVSVGGSILVYGEKNDGSDWKIGIRNPIGAQDDMIGYLSFPPGTNTCVSTSGDYEKFFIVDGVRYHHILSRETGYPADAGLSSVTVVCANGLYSDALSTACFVLGYEKSLPLLEKYQAEAVFIDKDNHITVTGGLEAVFYEN